MDLRKFFVVAVGIGLANTALAEGFSWHNFYVGIEGGADISSARQLRPDYSNNFSYKFRPITYISEDEWNDNASLSKAMGGVYLGYYLMPQVLLELKYNHYGKFYYSTTSGNPNPADPNSSSNLRIDDIHANTLFLATKLAPKTDFGGFVPFISGAIGWSRNYLGDVMSQTLAGSNPNPSSSVTYGNHFNAFAWQVGAGADYHFNDHVFMSLGYRFVDLGKFQSSSKLDAASSFWDGKQFVFRTLSATVVPFVLKNFYVNEFYLGLSYKF